MSELTVSGKTIEEAIAKAVNELQTTKERISYKVIQAPKKGFLGIIGSQSAVIEVQMLPDPVEVAHHFLQKTVQLMGIDSTVIETQSDKKVQFEIKSEDELGRLIGKRGQTLQALEHLTNVVANRDNHEYTRIELDAENYRERRRQTLEQLAERVANKVMRLQEEIPLEPMNSLERKIIHMTIQGMDGVTTVSEGIGVKRHIIVKPEREKKA